MKRPVTVLGAFTASLLISSAALAHTPTFNAFEVNLKANPGQGTLTSDSPNKGCTKGQGQKKGCVNFPLDSIGTITFALGNSVKQCSDNGTNWVITKVELTHQGLLIPTSTGTVLSDKGIFSGSLPNWLESSFPEVDQQSGFLYEVTDKEDGVTRVTSLNLNNNTGGAKDIWYRVSVANCKSDVVLISDPRLENEGTN